MSDLAELFSRDPLSFTKDGNELQLIIEEMRKKRGQFNLGNARAGKVTKPSEKGKAVSDLGIGDIDL